MTIKTYDPANVVLTVGGAIISGYGEGTMVVFDRDEDAMTKHVGADGEVSRTKNANYSGSAAITLKATSNSNAVLGSYALLDELDSSGVVPMILKDNLGHTLFASECWVRKAPSMEWAKELSEREWVFDLAKVTFVWPSETVPA
jgi:hypothetical protein